MKNMQRRIYLLLLFALPIVSCNKLNSFSRALPIPQAAYIRIFNGRTFYDTHDAGYPYDTSSYYYRKLPDSLRLPPPMMALLIDPVMDASQRPVSATLVADFIGLKAAFYTPQPDNAGDQVGQTVFQVANADYPGPAVLPVAPVINGLDFSRWAQASSGKHRMVLFNRPVNKIDFLHLPDNLRSSVAVDTTIDLDPGQLYTMEMVNKEISPIHQHLYVRKETGYTTGHFDSSKIYVNFYDLTVKSNDYLPGPADVYYQIAYKTNFGISAIGQAVSTRTVLTPEKFISSVHIKFDSVAPFYPLDLFPADSLYYTDPGLKGRFKAPGDHPRYILNFYTPGGSGAIGGTPLFSYSGGLYRIAIRDQKPYLYPLINTLEFENAYDINFPTLDQMIERMKLNISQITVQPAFKP